MHHECSWGASGWLHGNEGQGQTRGFGRGIDLKHTCPSRVAWYLYSAKSTMVSTDARATRRVWPYKKGTGVDGKNNGLTIKVGAYPPNPGHRKFPLHNLSYRSCRDNLLRRSVECSLGRHRQRERSVDANLEVGRVDQHCQQTVTNGRLGRRATACVCERVCACWLWKG